MKRNFTREEIEELILDLGSDDQEVIDLAMSGLLMANPRRHLSDMIDALDWGDDIVKQRICYIFGGMVDNRCVDPLLSVLEDENIETRLAAIDSLQYFPNERIIPYLKDQMSQDDEDIHEAVIVSLGSYVKHGVINAHIPLVEIVQDENESIELRRMALMNLKSLDEEELIPILDQLKDLPDASIYSHILLLQEDLGKNKEQKIERTEQIIKKLLTEKDVLKQIRFEDMLVEGGSLAAKILIKKIFEQPDNAMLRVHARMIFEKMGYKSIVAFKWMLGTFDQFHDLMQVVLLQDLISLVAQRKYTALTRPMLKLLDRINAYIDQQKSEKIRKEFNHIKSDIHFALATYDCREGIEDMKAIMRDGTQRQFIQLIEALVHIGDRDFLIPLINQYQAYRDFKRPVKTVRRAFKAIVRREKIKRNDPMFNCLTELQKQNLSLIMKR